MLNINKIASYVPSVEAPVHKVTFKEKAKWTLIILVLFYVLGSVTVWGVNADAIAQFEYLEIVFGSKFGSILSLGIGPIVTASIILQLLVGSKVIGWDLTNQDDKKKFSGAQKLLTIAFCFIEAVAYVMANAVPPSSPELAGIVIAQLAFGGIIVMFMDEVVSKWGFGSGVSLFIVAGVAKTIFVRLFSPFNSSLLLPTGTGGDYSTGILPGFLQSLFDGNPAFTSLIPLASMMLVFVIVSYIQKINIEIPMAFSLPFGKFAARRWPLKFLYTSNIPVILVSAVLANVQVLGKVLYERGVTFLGTYSEQGAPNPDGIMYYVSTPSNVGIMIVTIIGSIFAMAFIFLAIKYLKRSPFKMCVLGALVGIAVGYAMILFMGLPGVITLNDVLHVFTYMGMYIVGATIFSVFWTATSGMDAKSVADQFKSYFIMIPGFRHDPRIAENVLSRYIPALTIMGGAFIGFLAAYADMTAAIGTGTGLLLAVMITYQLYEQITSQHGDDMPENVKKFLGE